MNSQTMDSAFFFLYDASVDKDEIANIIVLLKNAGVEDVDTHPFNPDEKTFPENATVFVLLSDTLFSHWLPEVAECAINIVPLAYEANPAQQELYGLTKDLQATIDTVFSDNPVIIKNYLLCNNELTLEPVSIGENRWMQKKTSTYPISIFSMQLERFVITTAKEQEIETAALMIEAGHEALLTCKYPRFFKSTDNQCHRATAVIYAPQSILGAIRMRFFQTRYSKKEESDTLPKGIGTLKAEKITITSSENKRVKLFCNKTLRETEEVVLENVPTEAGIYVNNFVCAGNDTKESLRIQNLPTESDLVSFFTKRVLPLVPIASENSFAELFTTLRESAKITTAYALLLIVSVLMATTGLFQNSSPTIIGAMILAPLMGPIIAFAMGAVRFDSSLLSSSIKTIFISTFVALFASALLTWLLPFSQVTQQMQMRTHPTLLDLAVAILAGIAAAYGYTHSKVGASLAGVAIAVALVPPLCVAGIGIGYSDWHIFANAFLLYLANIVGIVISSGIVFYLLGYASRKYVSTAFVVKFFMVAVIAVPLWLSTRTLVSDVKIYNAFEKIKTIETNSIEANVHLQRVIHKTDGTYALIYVVTRSSLNEQDRRNIAKAVKKHIGKDVHLIFTYQELYE